MKVATYLSIIILLMFLHGMSLNAQVDKRTAKKSYNEALRAMRHENFPLAINKGIIALKGPLKSKHRTKALEIVSKGYLSFYGNAITEINNLKSEHKIFLGKPTLLGLNRVVYLYENLLSVVSSIKGLNPKLITECGIDPGTLIDYEPEVNLSRKFYSEKVDQYVRSEYDVGLEHMLKGNKAAAYLAYGRFSNVVEFQSDFEDAKTKRAEAKNDATYYIKIDSIKFENGTLFASKLTTALTRSINNNLARNRSQYAQFIKLVNEQNSERTPDLIIKTNLYGASISVGQVSADDEKVSKEIGNSTKKVKSGNEEAEVTKKIKVEATVREYIQVRSMQMTANLNLVDNSNGAKLIESEKINGSKKDEINWWRFVKGDKRALSSYLEKEIEKEKPSFGTSEWLATDLVSTIGQSIAIRSLNKINSLFPANQ